MSPLSDPTSRFGLSAIRRYEPHIARIVDAFPGAVVFDHLPGSVETFAARLRDAMKGLAQMPVLSTTIDLPRFRAIHASIVVRLTIDGRCVVGGKTESLIAVRGAASGKSTTSDVRTVEPSLCLPTTLDAVVRCKHAGLLPEPIEFPSIAEIPTSFVESLQRSFDFELVPEKEGAIVI